MAILIGSVLLVVSYVVINAIVAGAMSSIIGDPNVTGNTAAFCASFQSNMTNITSALNIAGIGLIVAGIAGIVYMLIGLGGVGGGRKM